ncbi:MAG: thiamine biosynthesis protein ThiJ [Verrucomicrobiaceae bacterium]|nr:thiamine biosynthesis protein ThiJ [Verrucomicrobiaceae bacterium]
MALSVGIFIFDDIEVLDLGGPFEVFSVACRVKARLEPGSPPPFKVFTVGQTTEMIHARGSLLVTPQFSFTTHPAIDLLIIPGGVVTAELEKQPVIRWIGEAATQATVVASVCTGSFLLAKAGLLDGKRTTTHWSDIEEMRSMFPNVQVDDNVRWVEQGNLITSAGISAGIDMSLHLVSRCESEALAVATARQMDYDWQRKTP